ncbi:MAG: hypothetical protein AUK47_24980 [Deltaproteobacteria bacterium CG2_30_63_29]|nr:MAG: hypothetical protein AUK47_24980 [Deltaproteobacteria bacterium CG2_30_63_29]PIV99161.1 MAG: hypothetical protein COW42_11915 [Deltaproteobacteria bacterium CG17_big_fil_post_rev_8_21_14_2_50_63_7]PJB37397.1 MAG: hypothetical protein CO108_21220 [Deltaproteobacteria bacterium CG_4_9_14_3_um_filter_63_12]
MVLETYNHCEVVCVQVHSVLDELTQRARATTAAPISAGASSFANNRRLTPLATFDILQWFYFSKGGDMDPKKTMQLLEEVCDDIAKRKAKAARGMKAVGVGLAMGLAVACSSTDLYGTPPPDDTADVKDNDVTGPVDLYGIQADTSDDLYIPSDAYGVPTDVTDEEVTSPPVDVYGILVDTVDGDDMDEEVNPPVDLYGIQPDTMP